MKVIGGLLILLVALNITHGSEKEEETTKDREAKFLQKYVGYYSQKTIISVITRTKTAIFTCISATTTMAACTGRRRRSLIEDIDIEAENLDEIDSSSLDTSQIGQVPFEVTNREGKKVTVWRSVVSTLEIHTTLFNTGTTLTASALCNIVNGMNIGNSCFGG